MSPRERRSLLPGLWNNLHHHEPKGSDKILVMTKYVLVTLVPSRYETYSFHVTRYPRIQQKLTHVDTVLLWNSLILYRTQ